MIEAFVLIGALAFIGFVEHFACKVFKENVSVGSFKIFMIGCNLVSISLILAYASRNLLPALIRIYRLY